MGFGKQSKQRPGDGPYAHRLRRSDSDAPASPGHAGAFAPRLAIAFAGRRSLGRTLEEDDYDGFRRLSREVRERGIEIGVAAGRQAARDVPRER